MRNYRNLSLVFPKNEKQETISFRYNILKIASSFAAILKGFYVILQHTYSPLDQHPWLDLVVQLWC